MLLSADSVAIREILKPVDWHATGGKAFVVSPQSEKVVHVYDLPGFEHLYSFGTVGNGPGEFADHCGVVREAFPDGNVRFFAQAAISAYLATDTSAVFLSQFPRTKFGGNRYTLLADTLLTAYYIMRRDDKTEVFYRTGGLLSGVQADSLPTYAYSDEEVINDGGRLHIKGGLYNVPRHAVYRRNFVLVYPDVHRIDFFEIADDGRFSLRKSVGDLSIPEQIAAMDWKNRAEGTYVCDVTATEKYVYTFWYDYTFSDRAMKARRSGMRVYDWEGRPVRAFVFDRPLNRFLLDEASGRVFAYDWQQDFDQVYVYRIPE